ncbi:uncharacterized protein Z518_04518 [Rhinocladiella mackenziei CBS 650.93]|uniref:Uncharacterized protein n=1 Tax=Rhinocladiella mackenziei CBS 650.93 TaxID=1442369 RepID=A0A0D2FWI0_9EURO|nr:uncharacterized protein Z518_04518 [Rhinocladiella mackenziei CBS 650.93]KIX06542.1 hypothetical protein Z518_04518 [Rhinocladiella mackenziei CBS 650.93]
MRTSVAIAAGLVAVASAKTSTITDTVDVTITSCEPTITDCPYKPAPTSVDDYTWGDWTSTTTTTTPVEPVSTTTYDPTWGDWTSTTTTTTTPVEAVSTSTTWVGTWGDWTSTTTPVSPVTTSSSAACGSYTATAPPAWFSLLPSSVLSSIEAKWTGAPPADWCYYTYSTSTLATSTPVAPASSTPYWPAGSSSPVAAASGTGTGVWSYTPSSPVSPATFTGAANANAGSLAIAGLAAAAALVIA